MICLLHRWGPWEDVPTREEKIGVDHRHVNFLYSAVIGYQTRRCSQCNRVQRERT